MCSPCQGNVFSLAGKCSALGRMCSVSRVMCSVFGRMCSAWRARCSVTKGRGEREEERVGVGGSEPWVRLDCQGWPGRGGLAGCPAEVGQRSGPSLTSSGQALQKTAERAGDGDVSTLTGQCVQFWGGCVQFRGRCVQFGGNVSSFWRRVSTAQIDSAGSRRALGSLRDDLGGRTGVAGVGTAGVSDPRGGGEGGCRQ